VVNSAELHQPNFHNFLFLARYNTHQNKDENHGPSLIPKQSFGWSFISNFEGKRERGFTVHKMTTNLRYNNK